MLNNGRPDGGLLRGKTALIYGGGGSIGGAVARAFASEGAVGPPRRTDRGQPGESGPGH